MTCTSTLPNKVYRKYIYKLLIKCMERATDGAMSLLRFSFFSLSLLFAFVPVAIQSTIFRLAKMRSIQTKPTKEEKMEREKSIRFACWTLAKKLKHFRLQFESNPISFPSVSTEHQQKKKHSEKRNESSEVVYWSRWIVGNASWRERMKKRNNFHLWRSKWNFNDEKQLELQQQQPPRMNTLAMHATFYN